MKILILLMSCNNWFFKKEEEVVKNTWLKPVIDGQYPEVDWYFYTTGERNLIDKQNHVIYVNSNDNWDSTFLKTKLAFKIAKENLNYDYIVRTNLSTYVNLNLLVSTINFYIAPNNDKHVWGMELCNHKDTFYLIGKFLIFNKDDVDTIINSSPMFDTQVDADDYVYGCVFNDKDKYDLFKACYASPRLGSLLTYNRIDDYLLSCIAISYRVYTFDGWDEELSHRAIDEFKLAYKIDKFFKEHPQLTQKDFIECISYKNEYCFYNGIGTKRL